MCDFVLFCHRKSPISETGRQQSALDPERIAPASAPAQTFGPERQQHIVHRRGRVYGFRRFDHVSKFAEKSVSFTNDPKTMHRNSVCGEGANKRIK